MTAVTKSRRIRYNVSGEEMSGEDGQELLGRLRRGDKDALHALYCACQPRLFSYLLRLSGRREVAQDLCSEVWCRAAGKLDTLRLDSRLLPWLFVIGRNLFISHCRWRSRDEHYLNELGRLHVGAEPPVDPPAAALRSEREAALEAALARLPGIHREAVVLVAVEGLTREEAAEVAGISVTALRQRLSRGLKTLKKILAEEGSADRGEIHE